ncbi:MAG: hypothetical protein M3Q09_10665 [Gemmatimonadota bacterium]|nr:hypothetical protein [Gemmatimonadota bacterium]
MPLHVPSGLPSVFIRKHAFEREELVRSDLDERFNLTDAEFRVEADLVAIGPLPSDDMIGEIVEYLEGRGLTYHDDFFELSGNWPEWLRLYAM